MNAPQDRDRSQGAHPSREQLTMYFDGALDPQEAHAIEEHARQCPACSDWLERLEREKAGIRAGLQELQRTFDGQLTGVEKKEALQPIMAGIRRGKWRRVALGRAAVLLVAVGIFGSVGYAYYRKDQLYREVMAELRATRAAAQIQTPTVDSSRRELDRGREFSLRESEKPNQLVVQLSPFLGPPYYNGLQVLWDAEADAPAEVVYEHGYAPLVPLIRHDYDLPQPGGQRRVTLKLIYRLSGMAIHKFADMPPVIVEAVPLVLTSEGIRAATGEAVRGVSAVITNPATDGATVPEEFTLEFTAQAHKQDVTTTEQDGDRMLHVLIRPLDGPPEDQTWYSVQPFTQRVSELPEEQEARFDTWAALPSVSRRPVSAEGDASVSSGPTRFEVLLVELPVRLVRQALPKAQMDLDDPQLRHEVVRARRVVRYAPGTEHEG